MESTEQPKRHVLPRITLFLTASIVILVLVNAFVQPIWPSAEFGDSNRDAFYDEPSNSIQCVFVGASTFITGISPLDIYEQYGINSYNLSSEQQPTFASYYWVKEAHRLHPQSLKVVILDASMLRRTPEESFYRKALDGMHLSNVKLEAICDHSHNPIDFFSSLFPLASYHDRWSSIEDSDYYKFFPSEASETRGFSVVYFSNVHRHTDAKVTAEALQGIDPPLVSIAREDLEDLPQLDTEALKYLDKLYEYCQQEGISLVVARTPVSVGWSSEWHYAVQEVLDTYGIPFLDYNTDPLHDEVTFNNYIDTLDGGHLDYHGAKKLSANLGSYLASMSCLQNTNNAASAETLSSQLDAWSKKIPSTSGQWNEPNVVEYIRMASTNDHTVFVMVKDEASNSLTDHQRESLDKLGLHKLSQLGYRDSYLAIINNGKVVYEQRKAAEMSIATQSGLTYNGILDEGTTYALTSGGAYQGDQASCVIDGKERALNRRGINVVVYDTRWHKVVASTHFDTYAQSYGSLVNAPSSS